MLTYGITKWILGSKFGKIWTKIPKFCLHLNVTCKTAKCRSSLCISVYRLKNLWTRPKANWCTLHVSHPSGGPHLADIQTCRHIDGLVQEWRNCSYVIMSAMASRITSLTIVYSAVYSGAGKRKHQSSASMAFARGIHRWPVNFPHKGPVTRKIFPFDDVIMVTL